MKNDQIRTKCYAIFHIIKIPWPFPADDDLGELTNKPNVIILRKKLCIKRSKKKHNNVQVKLLIQLCKSLIDEQSEVAVTSKFVAMATITMVKDQPRSQGFSLLRGGGRRREKPWKRG